MSDSRVSPWSWKGTAGLRDADMRQIRVGLELAPLTHRPDKVDLFRYSAALWLAHLIHYDERAARAEGHDGLVVHGPLQGAFLLHLVENWLMPLDGRVLEMRYRHQRSAYAGDTLVAGGEIVSVNREHGNARVTFAVALVRQADGAVTTSGQISVEIPDRLTDEDPPGP